MQEKPKRTKTLEKSGWLATAMAFLLVAPLGSVAADDVLRGNCVPSAWGGNLANPTPETVSAALDLAEEQRYQLMSSLFPQDFNEAMDQVLREPEFFPVGDLLYGGGSHPARDAPGTDPLIVAEQFAHDVEGDPRAEILKELLQLVAGSTPTLRSLAYIQERSPSRDRWDISVTVHAFGACGQDLGGTSEMLTIKDEAGTDQSAMHPLDLPLKKITANVGDIEILSVSVRTYHCKSGWWTGKSSGCLAGSDAGDIKVEIVNASPA